MKDEVALQKLDSLARCIERLKAKKPASIEVLEREVDLQDILIINLERLVQSSVDLAIIIIAKKNLSPVPTAMSQSFEVLKQHKIISEALCHRLQKAVGFRNLCVHEYDKINWNIVYSILDKHLQDFVEFGKIVQILVF